MRVFACSAITASVVLALSLFLLGCTAEDHDNLSGFWTQRFPDGREVTRFKLEKKRNGYRMIPFPLLLGRCVPGGMSASMRIANKEDLAELQINGLEQALIEADDPRIMLLVGPRNNWVINGKVITSGYAYGYGHGLSEVHQTARCYGLTGN